MAGQTVIATSDVDIHVNGGTPNREGNTGINFKQNTPNKTNIFFRFDLTTLIGKIWNTVVLKLTVQDQFNWLTTGPLFLGRVLRPMVFDEVTDLVYASGLSWDAEGAQNSVDNDHTTRVDIFAVEDPLATLFVGDVVTSLDISDLAQQAIDLDAGILDLIYYPGGSTAGGTVHQYEAIESGAPITNHANLFFSNVSVAEYRNHPFRRDHTEPSGFQGTEIV